MNDQEFDKAMRERARTEDFRLPEDYPGRVFAACASLKETTESVRKKRPLTHWAAGVAAALAVFVAVPNLSAGAAAFLEDLPLLGPVVEVITFRHYTYDDGHGQADVETPRIQAAGNAAAAVNADIQAYVDRLTERFQADCAALGEGYESLDVTYSVVTDTEDWFTLRVDAVETMASGYQFSRFYNIDKAADAVVPLEELFRPDSGWAEALTEEVLRQMTEQEDPENGVTYFPEEFTGIDTGRNYYFDGNGGLVLVFDEYEIAPGSMGMPEFTIGRSVYEPFLK